MPKTASENPARRERDLIDASQPSLEGRNNLIAREIRRRRRALDLTQEQVAEFVGVNKSQVGHWETGRSSVRVEHLQKLANFLHCEPKELMEGPPNRENLVDINIPQKYKFASTKELIIFATSLATSLTPKERMVVRLMLDAVEAVADDSDRFDDMGQEYEDWAASVRKANM